MNDSSTATGPRFAWTRLAKGADAVRTRADLATLRRGLGKEPGAIPGMWPMYTCLSENGLLTDALRAEHTCLSLFGLHQQSQNQPMHVPRGLSLGQGMRLYRLASVNTPPDAETEPNAIDKRVAALASSTTFRELQEHLRRSISLLRSEGIALDYDRLHRDLTTWQRPARRPRIIRAWGAGYYVPIRQHEIPQQTVTSQKGETHE